MWYLSGGECGILVLWYLSGGECGILVCGICLVVSVGSWCLTTGFVVLVYKSRGPTGIQSLALGSFMMAFPVEKIS